MRSSVFLKSPGALMEQLVCNAMIRPKHLRNKELLMQCICIVNLTA
jgi:hypothetical protein